MTVLAESRPPSVPRALFALTSFAGLTAGAALGGVRDSGNTRWYRRLKKPPFQPPPAVFGPVWTVLYSLITVSAYRVWRRRGNTGRGKALGLWALQLGLNALWSPLFFRRKNPRAALADISLMLPAIALYARAAGRVDRAAGWMMTPYLGWVSFATLLNADVVRRNA